VIWEDKVFVTCYSGYGMSREDPGRIEDLVRHLVCVSVQDGQVLWQQDVPTRMPEDPYQGFITEHGYASQTPVTDGEHVYVFFGKSGVLAFDLQGQELWRADVGQESSSRRWGSAASPILFGDTVIVNASEESQSIRALDRNTGAEKWRAQASRLDLVYGTPAVVPLEEQGEELVVAAPGEIWGLEPNTGKLKWYAETSANGNICPSVVTDGRTIFAYGGLGAGSLALSAGGQGDVTGSNILWKSREGSYVATPLLHEGRLHWVDDRAVAHCADAKTGELIYRERLRVSSGGRPFYSSMVLAGGHLYAVSRHDGTFVIKAGPEFELVSQNSLPEDSSDFNATPAIANGRLYLRSDRFLYCLGK